MERQVNLCVLVVIRHSPDVRLNNGLAIIYKGRNGGENNIQIEFAICSSSSRINAQSLFPTMICLASFEKKIQHSLCFSVDLTKGTSLNSSFY